MLDDQAKAELAAALNDARRLSGSLAERLRFYAEAQRRVLPHYAAAADALAARLTGAETVAVARSVGEPMPDFLLPDEQHHLVSLADVLSTGPAVIAFQRGHWCPFCRMSAAALTEIAAALAERQATLIVVSPETSAFAAKHKATAQAPYRWLSDIDLGYALLAGVAIYVGDEMRAILSDLGVDLPMYHDNAMWCLPIPATFIVRRDGIIAARFIDPDYRRRADAMDVLAAVEGLV